MFLCQNGFGFIAKASTGLLIGKLDTSGKIFARSTSSENRDFAEQPILQVDREEEDTVVPTAEIRLGARYTHELSNGRLLLEGGWHMAGVFHSIRHLNSNFGSGYSFANGDVTNFGIQGPYLGLKWVGNYA